MTSTTTLFRPKSAGQNVVVIGGSAGNAPRPSTPSIFGQLDALFQIYEGRAALMLFAPA